MCFPNCLGATMQETVISVVLTATEQPFCYSAVDCFFAYSVFGFIGLVIVLMVLVLAGILLGVFHAD